MSSLEGKELLAQKSEEHSIGIVIQEYCSISSEEYENVINNIWKSRKLQIKSKNGITNELVERINRGTIYIEGSANIQIGTVINYANKVYRYAMKQNFTAMEIITSISSSEDIPELRGVLDLNDGEIRVVSILSIYAVAATYKKTKSLNKFLCID